jgi:hypothetical protein
MTAPHPLFSRDSFAVNPDLLRRFADAVGPLFEAVASDEPPSPRDLECNLWKAVVGVGRDVLSSLYTERCRVQMQAAVRDAGLDVADVKMRMDRGYWTTLTSTFGQVRFPMFAYRDPRTGQTEVPSRSLFPLYPRIRSTELTLEWEAALAADHPFRQAADALLFFTHGATDLEDNTIERHAVLVGGTIDQEWLYLRREQIRKVLLKRATRDEKTGKPIVFVSTDAHALRRFTDETWKAEWKMCNGIRVWCVDRKTGRIIHLGGEYTWGDCREVAERIRSLQALGLLPADGNYGDGLVAQMVVVTDGADWIVDHVLPLFPDAEYVLDAYHVVEQVAETARALFPRSKRKVKQVVRLARRALGVRDRRPRTVLRKGNRRQLHRTRKSPSQGSGRKLLLLLDRLREQATTRKGHKRLEQLIAFVGRNVDRLDYHLFRARGFQIGSGAMEALHRTGSQVRLKRSGCRWTGEVAQAVLNLRMLVLSGRWGEFWAEPGAAARIAERMAA